MKQTGRIFECDVPMESLTGITTLAKIEISIRGGVVVTLSPFSDKPAIMTFDSLNLAKRSFADLADIMDQINKWQD